MERVTISLDETLLERFDGYIEGKGYGNRSEAVRDLIRAVLEGETLGRDPEAACIACLTYVYDHEERNLASRLTRTQHEHHDMGLSTLHVHVDHDTCMEAVILRGAASQVRAFSDSILAQPGVRHGNVNIFALDEVAPAHHDHGTDADHGHEHGNDPGHDHGHRHS